MMALLPISCALLTGLALVATLAPTLSCLQMLGAAMAIGPAAVAGLMSLAFMGGLPLDVAAWTLTSGAFVLTAILLRSARNASLDRREWIGVGGAAVLLVTLLLRIVAAPVARGDGIAIHLLRAEAMLQNCFWEWARSAPAVTLHADYPPGMPALMATGSVLGGGEGDLSALAPLVLALPGALLFLAATLARSHGSLAAITGAVLMAFTPGLRTHAVAGYADPLLAATLLVGGIALARREAGLVVLAALLMPWLKLEGLFHALLLALLILPVLSAKKRIPIALLLLLNAMLWFVVLRIHGVTPPVEEAIPDDLRADLASLLLQVFTLAFTPHPLLAVVPGLGILAALLLRRDAHWKRVSALYLLLMAGVILLPWFRGTALEAVKAGDTLHRIFTQTIPLAILLAAAAASRIFTRESPPQSTV